MVSYAPMVLWNDSGYVALLALRLPAVAEVWLQIILYYIPSAVDEGRRRKAQSGTSERQKSQRVGIQMLMHYYVSQVQNIDLFILAQLRANRKG